MIKNKTIYFLTNSAGKIPQKLHETVGLDLDIISEYFISKGFKTNVLTYNEFISNDKYLNNIYGNYFFYASSQYPSYYSYIEDILLFIKDNGGIIIPEYSLFKAHENKFLQELNKKKLLIESPKSILVGTIEEGLETIKTFTYPIVAKLSSGFGSSSVSLLHSENEAISYLDKNLTDTVKKRKNIFKRDNKLEKYNGKYPLKTGKLIFQEFIKDLTYDWKILIFGEKLFYLKRNIKKDDFRASGSGNFDNKSKPNRKIMDFAYSVKEKLGTPFASLDVIEKDGKCMLIEYQTIHFGLYTVINSLTHFILDKSCNDWKESTGSVDVDMIFAEELYQFIVSNNQ